MSRFLALLGKDARLLLRHRALLAALLAYPFLLALVLGAAFQEPPSTLQLAVVDQDRSGETVDVGGTPLGISDLIDSARPFADIARPATEEEALRLLRDGSVDAVLIVPRGFMSDLSRLGSNATLRLVVDEADPIRAAVARAAVEGAVDAFVEEVVQKKIDDVLRLLRLTETGGRARVLFVDVNVLGIDASMQRLEEVRATVPSSSDEARKLEEVIDFLDFTKGVLGNSELYLTTTALPLSIQSEGLTTGQARVTSVSLPGALVLGVFWTGALAAALLVARERETGTHRRLAAAPHAAGLALASKAVVSLLAALVPGVLVLVLGILFLGAQVFSPALTVLVLVLASLSAAALGALAAGVARGSGAATLLAVLALVPMLLLAGLFYPLAYMPDAARAIALALPVTMANEALRGAMLRGSSLVELALPMLGLVASALVMGAAALVLSRRSA